VPKQGGTATRVAPWHRCDRCGWDYRVTDLRRQRGMLLCYFCYDNPIYWQRPQIIQDVLAAGAEEELAPAQILREPTTEGDDINSDI
jgi:hypothetical protein